MKQNAVKKFFEKIKYVFSSINQDIKQRYENEIELERVWREHTQKKQLLTFPQMPQFFSASLKNRVL